jgi:carbonic anhydrase/acetyltransferase-like protein (isoleucine patch superfamily)
VFPTLDPALLKIAPDAFIAKNATVVGNVHIGSESSLWFSVVIRGDVEAIRVGARTNIQDLSMIHADHGFPCVIDDEVTVGHRCIIHGAHIGRRALVGMGAIIMNGAVIGEECVIGAGALIPEGKQIPPRSLVVGMPGKVIRALNDDEIHRLKHSADHYAENGAAYKQGGYGR